MRSVPATWSGAGEGEQLWFLGTLAIFRVAGEASDGRFALIEFLFPRNASPPLHTHPQDESYIVDAEPFVEETLRAVVLYLSPNTAGLAGRPRVDRS